MIFKKSRVLVPVVFVSILALVVIGGCAKKSPMEPQPTATPEQPAAPAAKVETYQAPQPEAPVQPTVKPVEAPVTMVKKVQLEDVFFAFDVYALTPAARDILSADADVLSQNTGVRILIEGHCDERGTREYNLGLGERRANSTKNYLVSLGVDASRIQTISYGEDRPFALGHNESAWSKNRRAHIIVH